MWKRVFFSVLVLICLILLNNSFVVAEIVTIAVPADPDSFDPLRSVAAATGEIAFNIYEGLVKATPEGGIEGALASSWTIDDTKTVYTFQLRKAFFHDGSSVTAFDVVTALNKARDPDLAVRAGELSMIKSVVAKEDGVVEIELVEPHGAFLYSLSELFAVVYPAQATNLSQTPVGTGPYKLHEWKPNQHLILERFAQHWSGEEPYFSIAKFLILPDENSMVLNLKAGRVDLIPRLEVSVLHQVEQDSRIQVASFPMNVVQVLAVNNERYPFSDWRVRKALALAVNEDEVILGAAWGLGSALHSALSPAMSGFFNPELGQVNPYDPNKARALLAEAGQENLRLILSLPANYPLHVQTGQLVAQQWKQIGVNVELEILEWGTWLEKVYTGRDYEVSIIGLAGRLDPHAILVRYQSGNSRNFFNFSDERYDELIQLGLRTSGEERQKVYWQAQEILANQLPGIFIMDPPQLVAMAGDLKGFRYYPTYVVNVASLYK